MRRHRTITTFLILAMILSITASAWAQTTMDASKAEKTRYDGTVAIFYCTHFEDTAAHDWEPIKEWNGPYHPVLGEYTTADAKVIKQHVQWMRRAGVDVIFFDIARIQPELSMLQLAKQKTLQLLVEELAHQEKETRKLKLVIWMEKWNSNPTVEEYKFGMEYVRKNLANRDFYYQFEGKPLIMTYVNSKSPELDKIDEEYKSIFTLRRISPYKKIPGWKYIGPDGDKECMTVNPSFDGFLESAFMDKNIKKKPVNTEKLREHGKEVIKQRADGKMFESQLLKAREVNPKVIFVAGFNDWACSMQIEPAKEYGNKYLDLCAKFLGREAETLPYRTAEDKK
jgi:hypothetical protein